MQFKDIIGQTALKEHLVRSVESGRISHAQLFTGATGTGALPLAVAYVQYLNCTARHDGDSCGECPSCRQIAALAHPDVHLVYPVNKQGKKSGEVVMSGDFIDLWRQKFAATGGYFSPQEWYDALNLGKTLKGAISAKEADEIIRSLSYKSYESEYKATIIWLPETMSEEASNKILKILEEPWDKTVFILVTERADRLLKTILSRTQEVAVPRIEQSVLERQVMAQGEQDVARARNTARLAAGDVLELRRLLSGAEDDARHENFELFCSLMRLSYNDKHLELIRWATDVALLSREQQRSMLLDTARLLRESYMINVGVGQISYLWGEEAAFCRKFAPFIDSGNVEPIIAQIESAMMQIAQNGNPTIIFTHFALAVSKHIKHL